MNWKFAFLALLIFTASVFAATPTIPTTAAKVSATDTSGSSGLIVPLDGDPVPGGPHPGGDD